MERPLYISTRPRPLLVSLNYTQLLTSGPPPTIIADKPLHLLSNRPFYINTLQLDLYFTSTIPPFLSAEATPQSYSWKPHLVDNSHHIVTSSTGFNRPPHTYDLLTLNNQNLQQSTLADH